MPDRHTCSEHDERLSFTAEESSEFMSALAQLSAHSLEVGAQLLHVERRRERVRGSGAGRGKRGRKPRYRVARLLD